MSRGPPWLRIALPWLVLNALLTLGSPAQGPWLLPTARVSIELCAGIALLGAWLAWRGSPSPMVLRVLAAASALLVLYHLVDVAAAGVFGRPLNLYWDGRHVGSVLTMSEVPAWQFALGAASILAVMGGVVLVVRACWRALGSALALPASRTAVWTLVATLLVVRVADGAGGLETWRWFADPVAPAVARQARLWVARTDATGAAHLPPSPTFGANLDALQGADVLVLFSESYGACTFDDATQARALEGPRQLLAQAIAASGREVVSSRVRSPTFGGGSWLAHGALLSGIDTRDPMDYDQLLTTTRPTLVSHFGAHGYRTVNWAPGLQRPWPEGRFYGFDRYADAATIGYLGLPFGAWRLPDQASMALLHAQELAGPTSGRQPRFVVFPTVNSHAPFHPLPPFVADWERLLGPGAYTPQEQAHALEEVASWRDPVPPYVQSIALTWQWLGAYLREKAPQNLVVILIGDHQPWARVSGGGSWDVPVHVIGADRRLLRRFEQEGFTQGLQPRPDALEGMNELAPLLSRVFAMP